MLGEAAAYESANQEITLDPALWQAAAVEQDRRRVSDPWEDILDDMPTHAVEDAYGHVGCSHLADGEPEPSEFIKIVYREDGFEKVASASIIRYRPADEARSHSGEHFHAPQQRDAAPGMGAP